MRIQKCLQGSLLKNNNNNNNNNNNKKNSIRSVYKYGFTIHHQYNIPTRSLTTRSLAFFQWA